MGEQEPLPPLWVLAEPEDAFNTALFDRINWIITELSRSRGAQRELIRGTSNIWTSTHTLAQSMSMAFVPGAPSILLCSLL